MTLAVDQITDEAGTGAVSLYLAQTLKATLILDGNTPVVTASLNHSSLGDNGDGDWTNNYTNSFSDALYGMVGSVFDSVSTQFWPYDLLTARTVALCRIGALSKPVSATWAAADADQVDQAVWGDLA